jgi:hypothetical protein
LIIRGLDGNRACAKKGFFLSASTIPARRRLPFEGEDNRRSIVRNQMTGGRYAVIAGAAMLLSVATPALAQGVPGGSYLQSCSNARMFGDRLVAECQRTDGSWDRTALRDVGRCVGGVANMNGQLTCNYGEPGYGSSDDRSYSSAPSRYYGYPRYYGYGR